MDQELEFEVTEPLGRAITNRIEGSFSKLTHHLFPSKEMTKHLIRINALLFAVVAVVAFVKWRGHTEQKPLEVMVVAPVASESKARVGFPTEAQLKQNGFLAAKTEPSKKAVSTKMKTTPQLKSKAHVKSRSQVAKISKKKPKSTKGRS